ncbi:nicotinate phosphoribosyltransferase [Microbulbifer thermotolerans]|uniref:nicotinate phosphoribosyltransferase n=1 Tax=Microbulbifer thermotolerans TaxID=252514 RepID=UPI00224B7FA9|nr:nicotinate phosphoribosyltransferase [Microbulbifer thermotolerans]MCX2782364.1 nicotinate phosphoribosyltransferase [Microbulbifer thermotolerans]MCX2833625.1 nicotinate phosphoribosyltransferase [Microbulbifer thermotolerans]WKT62214.1 nicotinate phosphoribosyltransferase [Microbulbifer thermotolerans]
MQDYNPILNVDSYKTSHYLQYPEGTQYVSSYIESRGGQFKEAVFFGLQAFIKQYLSQPITRNDIEEAEELCLAHGVPFNRAGWEYILEAHQGYLPIEIQAVPEGTVVPVQNVLAQVVNTDPKCFWITSYVETALLRAIWYPTTVATQSREAKKIIQRYLEETADTLDGLPFKLHDFGARGASSGETAALGGLAHLVNFQGTDTVAALVAGRRFYNAPMAGFSIPAAEHSTMTSWGREHETEAYANMLTQFAGDGRVVAVVSDSYNLWNAIDNIWGGELKERVENNGGTLVIRPDSGDPVDVVTQTIERLMRIFGARINSKGYRVLPDYIRVIQGDGISLHTIEGILAAMKARKQSADNIAFGMGAELLQKVHRDTMKFAMKASAVRVNGLWRDVFKDPVTDTGKRSKKGRLALIRRGNGELRTIREQDLGNRQNLLQPVFRNGKLLTEQSLEDIRRRAAVPHNEDELVMAAVS